MSNRTDPLRRHLLIVAFRFPPHGGSGPRRILEYTKYLAKDGWQITVLTGKHGGYKPLDFSLLKEIPAAVKVVRTQFLEFKYLNRLLFKFRLGKVSNFFSLPKTSFGWFPFTLYAGIILHKKYGFNAIYSSSPPFSSHFIAFWIKKLTNLPWIAVYQDEYSFHPLFQYPSKIHKRIASKLDRMILRYADFIEGVTESYTKSLAAFAAVSNTEKFVTITNGFDPDDFPQVGEKCYQKDNKKLKILYVGSFFRGQTGHTFLKAAEELLDEGKILIDKINISFCGKAQHTEFKNKIYARVLSFTGFVNYHDAISKIASSNILLLVLTSQRGAATIPGKAFEYIASGKPILAVVPPKGECSELIEKTRTGFVANVDDVSEIKATILKLYHQWERGELFIQPDWETINRYKRSEQVKASIGMLDSLIAKKS